MQIDLGVAKINKYAVSEGGDSIEVVERPQGGISVIVADGQGSGPNAKRISRLVVGKAATLIGEGARDGAVARAVHDYLFALRGGKVSATLAILSVDLDTRTLVISRNGNNTVIVRRLGAVFPLEGRVASIGVHRRMRPRIDEFPLEEGLLAVVVTDGITHAGRRRGNPFKLERLLEGVAQHGDRESQALADAILYHALLLDENRPADDMTVAVLQVKSHQEEELIQRMGLSFPFR